MERTKKVRRRMFQTVVIVQTRLHVKTEMFRSFWSFRSFLFHDTGRWQVTGDRFGCHKQNCRCPNFWRRRTPFSSPITQPMVFLKTSSGVTFTNAAMKYNSINIQWLDAWMYRKRHIVARVQQLLSVWVWECSRCWTGSSSPHIQTWPQKNYTANKSQSYSSHERSNHQSEPDDSAVI